MSLKDDNGAEAVKLNTSAQMCSWEVLVRFEPTIFRFVGERRTSRTPGLDTRP